MPQLQQETAAKVDKAESGFALLDPGLYVLALHSVEVKEGPKGPYWSWRFDIPEEFEHANRRFYVNTSLSEAAYFKLKEAFAAFEVPTTTNTDDLIGRRVRGVLGHETIGNGPRMGELRNNLESLLPLDGPTGTDEKTFKAAGVRPTIDVSATDPEDVKGGSTEEPLF